MRRSRSRSARVAWAGLVAGDLVLCRHGPNRLTPQRAPQDIDRLLGKGHHVVAVAWESAHRRDGLGSAGCSHAELDPTTSQRGQRGGSLRDHCRRPQLEVEDVRNDGDPVVRARTYVNAVQASA